MRTHRSMLSVVAGAATMAMVVGCASADPDAPQAADDVSAEAMDEALSTPTTLTFWTWLPDIQEQVDLFTDTYPAIEVEVVNAGGGATGHYQKLRTAIGASDGAPDVAQLEYPYIDSFDMSGALLDLAPYGLGELEQIYAPWIWDQVSDNGRVLAVPQDTGPVGYLYREDLLGAAGIDVPQTWDDYREAAIAFKEQNPDGYLANLSSNDASEFLALLWQAGVRPFSYDGDETVAIDLDSSEALAIADYWTELIGDDLISNEAGWTDSWYQSFATGRFASWVVAAWGPMKLEGPAGQTAGSWRAAEMPQWDEDAQTSANWGGSTVSVLSSTGNPMVAAEFARFINAEYEPALIAATEQHLFPASEEILEDPAFIDSESSFFGDQRTNEVFSDISASVDPGFEWLPFADYLFSSYNETVGRAIAEKTDIGAGLTAWEEQLTAYAIQQGFTVES